MPLKKRKSPRKHRCIACGQLVDFNPLEGVTIEDMRVTTYRGKNLGEFFLHLQYKGDNKKES